MQSGWGLVIGTLIGVSLICLFVYSTVKDLRENRENEARLAAERAARPPAPVSSVAPVVNPLIPQAGGTNPALAWNVVVIVVGVLIALIGLINGLAANPESSALRQTVGALWVIQGLLGLLIAAVGILGATIASAIGKARRLGDSKL
jgi:fumarate reductase subunit D